MARIAAFIVRRNKAVLAVTGILTLVAAGLTAIFGAVLVGLVYVALWARRRFYTAPT